MHTVSQNAVTTKAERAKRNYFRSLINNAKVQKEVFQISNRLLFRGKKEFPPTYESHNAMVRAWSLSFDETIEKIRHSLDKLQDSKSSVTAVSNVHLKKVLKCLTPATEIGIRKIISRNPTKSCSLDPMPSWLLKDCMTEIVHYACGKNIALCSYCTTSHGISDTYDKEGSAWPIRYKNYRPVSNFSFVEGMLGKVVAARLTEHITRTGNAEVIQSAYRRHHSMETALFIRVQNDLMQAVDIEGAAVLVLLHLSAAFDTIDQSTLLRTLKQVWNQRWCSKLASLIPIGPLPGYKSTWKFIWQSSFEVWSSSRFGTRADSIYCLYFPSWRHLQISLTLSSLIGWWYSTVSSIQAVQNIISEFCFHSDDWLHRDMKDWKTTNFLK